jgi:hypothetical protein
MASLMDDGTAARMVQCERIPGVSATAPPEE